jgi:hypothetical protein
MLAPSATLRSDLLFNAQPHPLESAASLPVPKPDYAFGFQLSRKRLRTQSSALDPFSIDFIERLKEKPGLYLNPHVNVCKPVSTLIRVCRICLSKLPQLNSVRHALSMQRPKSNLFILFSASKPRVRSVRRTRRPISLPMTSHLLSVFCYNCDAMPMGMNRAKTILLWCLARRRPAHTGRFT